MKKLVPIYPVLLGLYFLLAYYSTNYHFATLKSMVVPLVILLCSIGLVWWLVQLVVRNWHKSALLVSLLTIGFFVQGYLRYIYGSDATLPALSILVLGLLVILVAFKVKSSIILSTVSLVSSILLICLIGTLGVETARRTDRPQTTLEELNWESKSNNPDIYLIVPDSYPNEITLKEWYEFDNSRFISELESKGFCVGKDSYGAYPGTGKFFAGLVSMRYLESDETGILEEVNWWDSEVQTLLREEGYRTIDDGRGWGGGGVSPKADANLACPTVLNPTRSLLSGTLLPDTLGVRGLYDRVDFKEWVLFQFEELKKIPRIEAPTYTVVHTLGAHGPYVFTADGSNLVSTDWKERLVEQVQFTNKLLLDSIDVILETSSVPPIIIIMADTGPILDMVNYTNKNIRARLGILEAFYLPGLTEEQKSSFGAQVNTFRLLFNYYFDKNYEILPDRHFFYAKDSNASSPPYRLVEVTDTFRIED